VTAGTTDSLEVLRSRVSAALADHLPCHLERLRWDAGRLAGHQRDRLRAVLACAVERSPFYARRLGGIDPDTFELDDLARLPVMTKAQLMDNFDDVVTDRRLERRVVEEHLSSSTHAPSLLLDEYVCLASGGSSGVRGVFVQTVSEYTDMGASFARRAIARRIAAGGPAPGGSLIAYVAAGSPIHSTGFGAATATDGPVRFVAVPATLPLAEIVERLNTLQPAALSGYPSRLAQLADEQQAGRLRIAPSTVTASSEMLTPQDRAIITHGFGMPVINLFAATEGLVGLSDPGEDVLTFASDMCITELVDADHRPVPEGAPSARVLVTNLHNLTQPLIRYELTDSFVRHPDAGHGHLRATVNGRADDVFHYGNVSIHPHTIRSELTKSPAIREYQVRQTHTGVDVAIVVDDQLDDTALADTLEHSLHTAGLTEPHVTVRTVNEIARHPDTGKTTRFIPLQPSSSKPPL
jgi:phenylacetate-CoA ligase